MYYVAKFAQAAGLGVIAWGFFLHFPNLMNMRIFAFGVLLFLCGWIIQQYLLKK